MPLLSLLPTLGISCPNLIKVALRGTFGPVILQSTFVFLSNLNWLESLFIDQVDAAILELLARLPSVKRRTINEISPFPSSRQNYGSPQRFFSLEELHLPLTSPDIAITMVDAVKHRGLVSLNLSFASVVPDLHTTTKLYTAIASTRSYSTLISLSVEDEFDTDFPMPLDDQFDTYVVRGETLRILFPFTNLTFVNLTPLHDLDLDDKAVSEMARAWCCVEELHLASKGDP